VDVGLALEQALRGDQNSIVRILRDPPFRSITRLSPYPDAALTRLLPGAYATLLLADLGAEVIKIEDPHGGDGMRSLRSHPGGRNPYFERLNRNKRSVTLDLRLPEAAAVLDALAARADVMIDSFRPSTARRLGVDPETIRSRHPHLVCASISGFGRSGPYVERAAHDINYQALAGLLRPPALPGPLIGDIGSAHQAALAIAAALVERSRTGTGRAIEISIHEAALAWALFPTTADLAQARYNVYETADGRWLAMGGLEEKFWAGFCERLDLPPTASEHDVRERLRTRTHEAWLAHFDGADVCLTTVYSPDEVAADPHIIARAAMAGDGGRPAPALGADTDAILDAAGVDAAQRGRLRAAGVI
jgi:crotonobetainyl-CoA:carnitine CoA-transferase CaiB-like acyl-CoA transferase